MKNEPVIPSVDYLVLAPCNMKCKYCFATFKDHNPAFMINNQLSKEDALQLVKEFADHGFQKITFLGGEPLLCPWTIDLVMKAKQLGLITCITTNSSLLTEEKLDKLKDYLDWITISIDSINSDTLLKIGRSAGSKPISKERYLEIIDQIKQRNIKLKINTVVSTTNCHEDMTDFIEMAKPTIWKLIQVLPMNGQNSQMVDKFLIDNDTFEKYVNNAKKVEKKISIKVVDNENMPASYVLVDPLGRLIDTFEGEYKYSPPILKVGLIEALAQTRIVKDRFINRGGMYKW